MKTFMTGKHIDNGNDVSLVKPDNFPQFQVLRKTNEGKIITMWSGNSKMDGVLFMAKYCVNDMQRVAL